MSLHKMTRRWISVFVLAILVGAATVAVAQEKRPVKTQAKPTYPELARKMNVSGSVKVELVVAANGAVKSAKALGGHPLLIDAAVNAAKQCKYEAGADETKEVMEFKFSNSSGQ